MVARLAASPLVAVGEARREPPAAARRHVPLPRSLLAEERQVAADLRALGGDQAVDEPALGDGLSGSSTRRAWGGATGRPATYSALAAATAVRSGSRSSPAVRARARRRPWRGSSRCWPSRPSARRRSSPSRRRRARRPRGSRRRCTPRREARCHVDVRDALLALKASTLHRLLGWRPDSHSRFRHNRANRLPHDVVIVDETSMVSLSLMAGSSRRCGPRRGSCWSATRAS